MTEEEKMRMSREAWSRKGAFFTVYSLALDQLMDNSDDEALWEMLRGDMDIFHEFLERSYPDMKGKYPKLPAWKAPSPELAVPQPATPTATECGPGCDCEAPDSLEAAKRKAARELFIAAITGTMAGVKTVSGAKKAAVLARIGAGCAFDAIFGPKEVERKKRKYTRRAKK